MSREAYNSLPNIGTRGSPGNRARRLTELPQVDHSPSRDFHRGSPLGKPFTKIIIKKNSSVNHSQSLYSNTPKHPHIFTPRYSTLSLMSSPTYSIKTISTSIYFSFLFSHTNFLSFPPF